MSLLWLGICLPWLGAWFKQYVTEAVFLLLVTAFLRIDEDRLKHHVSRPTMAILATIWSAFVIPILSGTICLTLGLNDSSSELFLALILQSSASPMMATPALVALLGLDSTLVLVSMIACTALIPITAPLFISVFADQAIPIAAWQLAGKLTAVLAGAAVSGLVLRRTLGLACIQKHHDEINGFNIVVLFVFVAAIMENVGATIIENPWVSLRLLTVAFAVFFGLFVVTAALFFRADRNQAASLALMVSQRNMGLMIAATNGLLPELTWTYFAFAQIPIYLSPQLLKPIVNWIQK